LVEVYLLESRIIFESSNIGKARGSLTACRANANLILIPGALSAEIETTAGMLHLAEKDFEVAYSYFYEAFEI
jgi:26S proteasome regulatory subunit N6